MRSYNKNYLNSYIQLFKSHKKFLAQLKLLEDKKHYYEKGYIINFYSNAITYISEYSPFFTEDVKNLKESSDANILKAKKNFSLLPLSSVRLWAILLYKISPYIFKYMYVFGYKKIKA